MVAKGGKTGTESTFNPAKFIMNTNKTNIRPITYRQLRAIQFWLDSGRKNKAEALRRASYGKSVVRQPYKVFSSPSVQRELEMRGYGNRGILNNQKPPEPIRVISLKPAQKIDFSNLPREFLQDLKERLAQIPD